MTDKERALHEHAHLTRARTEVDLLITLFSDFRAKNLGFLTESLRLVVQDFSPSLLQIAGELAQRQEQVAKLLTKE